MILLDRKSVFISKCKIFIFQNKIWKKKKKIKKEKKIEEIFIPACGNQFSVKWKILHFLMEIITTST